MKTAKVYSIANSVMRRNSNYENWRVNVLCGSSSRHGVVSCLLSSRYVPTTTPKTHLQQRLLLDVAFGVEVYLEVQ